MLFIRIPYGTRYTATVAGYLWKYVVCSHCGCQYVYALKREETGEGTAYLWINKSGAADTARQSAHSKLEDTLLNEIGIFYCPDCGMYQENMVEKLKRAEMRSTISFAVWGGIFGALFAFAGLALGVQANSLILGQLIVCALVVIWIWLVVRRFSRSNRLNPNASASKRRGQPFSESYPVFRRAEFEEWQASKNKR